MRAVTAVFAGLIFAILSGPGTAQQEGGDFTFKRVGVPSGTAGKRITVQIDPDEEVFWITPGTEPRRPGDPSPETIPAPRAPAAPSGFEWYWTKVSPQMGLEASQRFSDAIAALDGAEGRVAAPRLQTLQGIADSHGIDILKATIGTQVSPAFVLAVIAVESAGKTDAVSHAGAQGLMQLMPPTAERFGVRDSMNPTENIRGGVAYLDWLLKEFKRDPVLALAGYNAGEGAVAEHDGVPPYKETRGYVPKVLAAWQVARTLCLTPPELVTDGCVFGQRFATDGG